MRMNESKPTDPSFGGVITVCIDFTNAANMSSTVLQHIS